MRRIHGDQKIDSFLFDDQDLADGMLDLDTVGAGIVHFDLGDCLHSCCNRGGESANLLRAKRRFFLVEDIVAKEW